MMVEWEKIFELTFCLQLFIAQYLFVVGIKRRSYFIVRLIGLFIICLTFFYFIPNTNVFLESLKYGLGFILMTVLIFCCYSVTPNYALFVTICAYSMQHLMYCVTELIRSIYDVNFGIMDLLQDLSLIGDIGGSYLTIYLVFNVITTTLIYAIGYFAMYWLFVRQLRKEKQYRVGRISQIVLSLTILISTIVLNILCQSIYMEIPTIAKVALRIFAIISCAFTIVIQFRSHEKSKLIEKNEFLDQLLHMEAKHHEISKENIDLINIKCHDLKKQMNTLRMLADEKEKEACIADMEKAIMIYDCIAKTGDERLDIVLTEKSLICEKEKIRFTFLVDGKKLDMMTTPDVYALFSNALDNAIESVCKHEAAKRIISLKVCTVGEMLLIEFLNYYEGNIKFEDGLPKTTNEDTHYHGFGVRSIRYIAEKYGGNLTISAENNIFDLKILIPLPIQYTICA